MVLSRYISDRRPPLFPTHTRTGFRESLNERGVCSSRRASFRFQKQNTCVGHTPRIYTLPAANVQILFPSREGSISGSTF